MKVFLDERCLDCVDLFDLLKTWRRLIDFAKEGARGPTVFLDSHAVRTVAFLKRFNSLSLDHQLVFRSMLFGSEYLGDWRAGELTHDALYRLSTEDEPVVGGAVCQVYEHRKTGSTIALFGHAVSSFAGRRRIGILKVEPAEAEIEVSCGVTLSDLQRLFAEWACLIPRYDHRSQRPPRDEETVLVQSPERFTRVGRFERHGRRHVYRESGTNRLFYVDDGHVSFSAHLEVFDHNEAHLGIANLEGEVDETKRRPGRTIWW